MEMGNPFLLFKILGKMLQKIYLCNYIELYRKTSLRFHLGPQDVALPKMHESRSSHFLDWALSEVQN